MKALAPVGNYIMVGAAEEPKQGINATALSLSIGAAYLAPTFVKPEQAKGARIIASVLTYVVASKLFAK